ncbi:xin actin-binding repeat-containing protein 1 [Bufo bufo]|uniref:xin actin-binding repeat-containing protein 1 n=1 Tax=Bufo bufo TaxID=8384 RepID=UPI001ABDF291|nr:xin actin-binding repeat-containing protein 1 [Bufo bufo]
MADNMKKLSKDAISEKKHEAEIPLPPPPDTATGEHDQCFMPPPPPKESFSKFYEQRQVNELKRLYRHMHPELRKNLEHAVSRDISDLLSNDEPNPQVGVSLDSGEVQSMRWIFENWNLDNIGEHQGNRKLTEEESVLGGNVKNTSLLFQGQKCIGGERSSSELHTEDQTKGDVKTALWLFETQPLDSLNKIYSEDADVQQAVLKDPVEKGDVKGTKILFETQSLDEVGRCNSVEEHSILQLKSEIQELKGDVNKTIKYFQTEPLCAIRDKTGNVHEIKSICREETQSNDVKTARWLFETQPLDTIHKDASKVQVIRGISLEEIAKGGVNASKWIFETQPLDTIKENVDEGMFQPSEDVVPGVDVSKQRTIFENQTLDSINDNTDSKFAGTKEILPGDVKSTLWLFETQPMETLKDSLEVGHLKKFELLSEERGEVQQRKHVFETCSLDKLTNKEDISTGQYVTNTEGVIKGDVKSFKNLFETLPHESTRNRKSVHVSNQDEIKLGSVKANQTLFESTPLYAIEDSLGNYHEVTSVSREQVISGDVKNYKWMFETKPLDQFSESIQKVDVIKGITKQEIMAGDVGTARWMFETQPIDVIHPDKNVRGEQCTAQKEDLQRGDVTKCRWLFETQPIDALYDKSEKKNENECPIQGDVNSYTWLFENQPLDSITDSKERYITVRVASTDKLESVNVKTTKHLFETEPLDSLSSTKEQKKMIRYSSRVEIQSGEVSRVKEIFESKPNVCVPSQKTDIPIEGNIPAGSVNKFTWLFENCPMDSMTIHEDGIQELSPEENIESGDVGGKIFIFETYSLDQIHQESDETEIDKVQEAVNSRDVKSCTMLFETKPLYAIQDKGGRYHEVTSVKKEEIQKGDVNGAKWLFETRPLDMINKDEEVFVIRAVTQEDIEKGCVKAARWRFETEPLDSISDALKHTAKTVDDVQKGDVQLNRQLFECQQVNQKKYVRLVSVSDVQKGNVRTSTWLFENQPIDCLKGENQDHCGIVKVQREDNQKGDVKRCTWLFESQPLDSLKDTESPAAPQVTEMIPKANVKSTTWLFESTPLDKFDFEDSTGVEQKEIHVKDTLDAFLSHNIIQHKGIVIENYNGGHVKMIKYQLSTQTATDIQKEETVGGNLQRILLQLLHRTDVEPHGLLVEENSSGQIIATKLNLLNTVKSTEQEEENVRDDVTKALNILLNEDASTKTGIIMEESESGSVQIIIYTLSLHCKFNMAQEDILKGNVKSTIGNLLACGQESKSRNYVNLEQNEKGNVQLFTSCIEKGDLGYLKSLQAESDLDALAYSQSGSMHQEENNKQSKQSTDQSKASSECVFVTSTPVFHPLKVHKSMKECAVDGTMKGLDTQKASSGCKTEKNINLSNNTERNVTVQKCTGTKQTSTEKNTSTLNTKFCVVGSDSNTLDNSSATSTDLQAALLDLRQATAEAMTIQKQVQCKIQNNAQEIQVANREAVKNITQPVQATLHQEHATVKQTASITTNVKDTRTSSASLQICTSSNKKVSVSEEDMSSCENKEITRAEISNIKDDAEPPKHAKNYLNPFSDCDYKAQIEQEERDQDIVRGDVKAAIRALQNASAEQREIEKEEVVKGNLAFTLESLQNSNVNVSKGDFKAAMIYRNAGQSYATRKRNSDVQHIKDQAIEKSMQPFDNNSPPSPAPVTEQGKCQAFNPSNVDATKDDSQKMNNPMENTQDFIAKACEHIVDENANASQTAQMAQRKKPALPPKPKHLLPGVCPPPRYKHKASLTTPSSPTFQPSTPANECSFKGIAEPDNMTMQDQSPSNIPHSCKYPTDINPEYEKYMIHHREHNFCSKDHVITNKNLEERVIKVDQNKQDLLNKCSASADSKLTTHTMPENYLKHNSEQDEHKQILSENVKDEKVSSEKSVVDVTQSRTNVSNADNKNVVMRIKRKKESEEARRQRLSIHMDEIMKDNVKAATDIFENLKKQDELENILKKVTELEEKTSTVDVKSVRGLFETVPDLVVSSKEEASPFPKKEQRQYDERFRLQKEDSESVSSVELAFEDLERASAEIKHLKEQTLAKILDIEETIKKALYAVSNLKSDSDIVSLSSLFRESLGTSTNTSNNIKKICIVSSKAKPEKTPQLFEQKSTEDVNQAKTENKKLELEMTTGISSRLSPISPSFITIESAARKTSLGSNSSLPSAVISNQNGDMSQDLQRQGVSGKERSVCDNGQSLSSESLGLPAVYEQKLNSPSSPNSQRQKSVLELKTGLESPKVIGTTIVTEKYEESDQYGNKIVRSKTSTTVTKQSDTHSSSTFEFVSAPPRYEVTASPILRRHVISSVDNSSNKGNETGVVFVTFGNSKPAQK